MKKFFLFLAAVALAMTANAKVTTISPDAENDALRLAVHYAEDGDIIEMTEGTYVQCNNGYVAFDGKSVTVKAAEGANVVLQLQVPITITNGGKANLQGIKIDASRLNDLADWYEHVIYANDATEGKELVMQGCELYGFNINKSAIYSSSSNTLALCDVKDCYFHDNMKSCFFFEGASIAELSVVNSTFANIATDATGYYAGIVDVRNADAKVTIDHSTFYNCLLMSSDYAAVTMKGPQAANVVIANNIFMLPEAIDGHRAIRNDVEATNCMTFNYVKDNGGIHSSVTKTNCFLNVDPLFVDAANGNFALAEGSPALGAATDGSDLGDPRWNKKADVDDDVVTVPTNAELWEAFKPYYNEYYLANGKLTTPRADQPIENVTTFAANYMMDIMTDAASEYKWLGDYVAKVTADAGRTIDTEVLWRFGVAAFFNCKAEAASTWNGNADFTEAGKPENWGPYYLAAKNDTEPDIEWIPMDLEIANLVTEVMEVEGAKYLRLQGRDDMNDADVMLFLNNYADVDDDYEVNTESSFMTFGGLELTVLEGVMTQTSETDKGTIYTGTVRASVEEEGETMYVEFALTMYAAPATVLVLTDAIVAINEELGTLTFNVPTGDGEGYYAELAGYTAPGVHEGPQICLFMTPEAVAYTNYAETSVADGIITLKGEFVSPMGPKFDVTISGKLPQTEPVVKPEPTYTENKLNTYAFGLESELNDSALVVTYRLNNSNATSVNVLVYKGENVVATVAGTTTIGVNTVAIPVANLPKGRMLTWSVEVNGTSVAAPTQEEKIYSFYHPSGVDVDNNPENPTFGLLLTNEAMQSVASKTDGYVSAQFGAGIFAFTPSFDLIPNGDQPGYNGGKTFSTVKNDFAPRRIRISEDGRIFATAQDGSGEYLWEINPENLNDWTTVFQGTNDGYTLKDADGNFIAGTNSGFDVRGEGENLQLLMLSSSLPGGQVGNFKCHTYDLGTATTWATAPTKEIPGANYMLVTNQSNAQFDKDGGVWYIQYRGTTTESEPGLVHINKDGVEDLKLLRHYTRNAGFRFTDDFSKVIIAGVTDGSNVKKATIYAVSQDENGAPVLTEETVIETSVLGSNLNDFAWDYAGNLYACGNSSEKLVAWAMPYSGQVVTPAASKYAFHIGELLPDPAVVAEMVGVVKRAVQNGKSTIVLTHETDGTAHIYEVTDGTILELLQNGVIAVDPENAGDYLAISDIAVTDDGKLVATNYMMCQGGDAYVDAGYKRGENRFYIWNDLHDAPSILFTSKMSSNWFRSKQGYTMAVKGTSDNMEIFTTGVHGQNGRTRFSWFRVIDGVYEEPAVNNNDHYHFHNGPENIHGTGASLEALVGLQYELNASPLAADRWIMDGELVNPYEYVLPATNNVALTEGVALTEDLGKKFNGASYVTVGEKVLMVAPYATPEGKLTGVEILDITGGLDAAQYVDQLFIDEAVEATAAATAVEVVEGDEATALLITLVADATIYSLEATLSNGPDVQIYEDEITNLVIDLDNLVLIGGPSSAFQVDVYLPLGEYNMSEDSYQLTSESSISVMGSDATFIEGYAYEIDAFAPSAKAVVRCEWNGMLLEFHLTMTAAPLEATVVVVENALVEIEKYLLWGDMYDYALTMSGEWVNPADGLTYPVLVEVPVYYPEATEPSEIMSTVTVGGWDDNDPWLGFGEGTLTVTTENISDSQKLITAKGIVQNPMAGVAIDITISGKIIPNALENVETTVAPVKVIKNGQLIIIKNGVEYNVQGAVIK